MFIVVVCWADRCAYDDEAFDFSAPALRFWSIAFFATVFCAASGWCGLEVMGLVWAGLRVECGGDGCWSEEKWRVETSGVGSGQ